MFRNYFKTSWRNLWRNPLYATLNIAGLTFGISCFLLIGLYLYDELTFDQHHSKGDRIYRVIEHKSVSGETTIVAAAGYKLAEESKKAIAEVENTTRVQRIGRANLLTPENLSNFFQETITVGDEHLFQIFDFPLLSGNKKTALEEPNSIVINESLAKILFNKTNVLGITLQFSFIESPLKITGILKNHPRNSSFNFSSIISEASLRVDTAYSRMLASDWLSNNFSVYTLLKPNANSKAVSDKMVKLVLDNFKPPAGTRFSFSLQPLPDIHLKSENIADGARNSNVEALAVVRFM